MRLRSRLPGPTPAGPPRWAERLLAIIHSDRGRFTHLGDFEEVFREIHRERGAGRAAAWYWAQALKSIPGFITNRVYWSVAMFKNYITIAFRNIIKNRGFSLINIAGLAVGMACFLLIMAYVQYELSYDRFHPNRDRIFRLLSRDTDAEQGRAAEEWSRSFPEVIGPMIESEIPEITKVTRWMRAFGRPAVLRVEDRPFTQNGFYADRRFLEVLPFPLVSGRPGEALAAPNTIVITASLARKLFGEKDPIGGIIAYREERREYDVAVSGVLEDIPANSSIRFDYLLSLPTLRADKRNDFMFNNMDVGNFFLNLELAEGVTPSTAEARLNAFAAAKGVEGTEMAIQPVPEIHLHSRIRGGRETNNQIRTVALFSAIALIVLLVACINAMNLATARASTRAREIGIRKVTGANRRQLIRQFLGESIFLAAASMGLGLLLMRALMPRFQSLVGGDLPMNLMNIPTLLGLIIATTLFVGLVSGAYPALFLSSLEPTGTLRKFTGTGKQGGRLRNLLVVIQFTASITLLICTFFIFNQMKYAKTRNLGFDREHVVIIPIRENETMQKRDIIRQAYLQLPQVEGVSLSSGLPISISSTFLRVKIDADDGETIRSDIRFDYVDEHFLEVFKLELDQGRNFSRDFSTDVGAAVIVNQELVRRIGWKEPLGKPLNINFRGDEPFRIVGVVKDFNFSTLHEGIAPMALIPRAGENICVRIRPGNVPETIALLKGIFETHTKGQPFDFQFLDDAFNRLYLKETRTGEIFGYFAGLTVLIACLGLFGLAAFAVERRTKEIGIRKVMGASILRLTGSLSGQFARLVVAANLIAWPLAYLAMHRWLQDFTYRIPLGPGPFLLAAGGALLIALLTVGYHTVRAASANPVESLRYE